MLKVLEAPDADEPRLVYADVLQERGDPRGEFIPLQCALARPAARADPEQYAQLLARESELLHAHGLAWTQQAVPFDCIAHYHRGFIEQVHCLPGELLTHGLEVVAPLRTLRLDGDTSAEVAQRLLALPMGARVQELTLRLVDSAVDASLNAAGAGLVGLRQLSPDENTIELLARLGWLWRLQRLELPVDPQGQALLEDLATFKPPQLKQLWLHRQGESFAEPVLDALQSLLVALPALTIRWRGVDYQAADALALRAAVNPPASQGQLALRPAQAQPYPWAVPAGREPPEASRPLPSEAGASPAPVEVVPSARPLPPSAPWDRWLRMLGLDPRGFVPRMLTERFALFRALANGTPVLVAIGPTDGAGARQFSEDVALALRLQSPGILRFVRSGTTDIDLIARSIEGSRGLIERMAQVDLLAEPWLTHDRGAVSEPFEGVSLWELQQLQRRFEPRCALRIVCQVARAAVELPWWNPSADDVLIDVQGAVRLLPGFPASLTELHPLGIPSDDASAPGARVMQLGTALFELLTGTALLNPRPELSRDDHASLLLPPQVDALTLASVDGALAPLDRLLAKAVSRSHADHYPGLQEFAAAIDLHPATGLSEDLSPLVRAALAQVPRTRDGKPLPPVP